MIAHLQLGPAQDSVPFPQIMKREQPAVASCSTFYAPLPFIRPSTQRNRPEKANASSRYTTAAKHQEFQRLKGAGNRRLGAVKELRRGDKCSQRGVLQMVNQPGRYGRESCAQALGQQDPPEQFQPGTRPGCGLRPRVVGGLRRHRPGTVRPDRRWYSGPGPALRPAYSRARTAHSSR